MPRTPRGHIRHHRFLLLELSAAASEGDRGGGDDDEDDEDLLKGRFHHQSFHNMQHVLISHISTTTNTQALASGVSQSVEGALREIP